MDEQREQSWTRAGLAASVAGALAASICCIGPIVAAFLGVTSLAALARFEPLRPALIAITATALGVSFYLAYRKRPEETCEPGSICATHGATRVQKINRIVLWIVAAIVFIVLTFPTWSNWVLG